MQIVDTIRAAQEEEAKEKMITASFSSWQIIETIKGLFSEKSKAMPFNEHLQRLGLADKKRKEDPKLLERKKATALTTAEDIKALDRQLQKGG